MARLIALGARAVDLIAALMAIAAIVLVCVEAGTRYLAPQHSVDWGTEVIIYLLVWATLLMSGRAAFENRHVAATVVVERLPRALRSVLYAAAILAGIGFGAVLVVYGWEVVAFSDRLGIRSDSSLRFPKASYYLILPVAGGLLILGYALRLWLFARAPEHRLPARHGPRGGQDP